MNKICQKIKNWQCQQLRILFLPCGDLSIHQIKFENLKYFQLFEVSIDSIEKIHRMWMPNLSSVDLGKFAFMQDQSMYANFLP